jgi:hypothetical protein
MPNTWAAWLCFGALCDCYPLKVDPWMAQGTTTLAFRARHSRHLTVELSDYCAAEADDGSTHGRDVRISADSSLVVAIHGSSTVCYGVEGRQCED